MPIPPVVLRDGKRKLAAFCRRHSPAPVTDKLRYDFSHVEGAVRRGRDALRRGDRA